MAEQVPPPETLHEAVGIFGRQGDVETAVRELMLAGFDRADISLLASEDAVRRRLGKDYQDTHLAEDDPLAPRGIWIEPESRMEGRGALTGVLAYLGAVGGLALATAGSYPAALAATAVGAGVLGGLGYGLGRIIDGKLAERMRTHLEHGGVVVWVKVPDEGHAVRAVDVLRCHGATDVHVHHMPSTLDAPFSPGFDAARATPTAIGR